MLRAIVDVNLPKFLAHDVPLFDGIVSDLFPGVKLPEPDYEKLDSVIKDLMVKHNLEPTPFVMTKLHQIYEMMLVRHGFMIVGDPLGGKTKDYQLLAEALSVMAAEPDAPEEILAVEYRIINPKSITMGQLYGCFDPVSHEWSDGILAISYREQANLCSAKPCRQWLLFDGPVDAVWIENMNTVLDDNKKLCLMSGEIIQMGSTMSMMFEPADLEQASPATVSRCGMIYIEPYQLGWKPLANCYLNTITSVIGDDVAVVKDLFYWLMDPVFEFIATLKFMMPTSNQHLAASMIKLFDAQLDEWRDEGIKVSASQSTNWVLGVFIFSMVWSLGATLDENGRVAFDEFFRQLVSDQNGAFPRPKTLKFGQQTNFPDKGSIYDYLWMKKGNGSWADWGSMVEKKEFPATVSTAEMIIPNVITVQQTFFLNTLAKNHCMPLLFVGPTGTGKSALTASWLLDVSKNGYVPLMISYSARTTAKQTQDGIMVKMDRRRKGVYGPPVGQKCIVFVDDLNMPQPEVYGAQPPIELLRTWLDHGFFYDLKDMSKFSLADVQMISAMGPPGGGRNDVTPRMTRHTNVITLHEFSNATMTYIFTSITDIHAKRGGYDGAYPGLARQSVAATLQVFNKAVSNFLPTPSKSHYLFNLRDFSRVILGCLQLKAAALDSKDKFVR